MDFKGLLSAQVPSPRLPITPEDAQSVWTALKGLLSPPDPYAAAGEAVQQAKAGHPVDAFASMAGAMPQTGAIKAYHGSPHSFDRFDMSKIGTGEGAQAYGHGLYFAENEGVARNYRDALAAQGATLKGRPVSDLAAEKYRMGLKETPTPEHDIADFISSYQNNARFMMEKQRPDLLPVYDELIKAGHINDKGNMYEVSINADPNHFLDWDKPLKEQGQKVQEAIDTIGRERLGKPINYERFPFAESGEGLHTYISALSKQRQENAADAFREKGIPGIKYLDQGSRGPSITYDVGSPRPDFGPYSSYVSEADAQKQLDLLKRFGFSDAEIKTQQQPQSRNYVVFDDKLIDILRKYGIVGLLGGGAAMGSGMQPPNAQPMAPLL